MCVPGEDVAFRAVDLLTVDGDLDSEELQKQLYPKAQS